MEPNVEQLMSKLKNLQQMQADAYQLEGIHKEKEELYKVLQFQCEEAEQESSRQLQLNKRSEEQVEQYKCQIEETKLKQRKQRMKFENQLQQLIDQHKNLHSVFTQERLPAEIESIENIKSQRLEAEQLKLSQLRHLEEELDEMRKQSQLETTKAKT
ncbi:synaptonemal complex central element protein 1 [Aplochiton taeniatus]